MLTKILLTLMVLIIAWHFLTRKRGVKQSRQTMITGQSVLKRYGIIGLLSLLLAVGLGVSVWHWYYGYQVVTVTISTPSTGHSETFKVRRKDIEGNRLATIDGLLIRVSDQQSVTVSAQ
ncbi:MAG: hypothetical protein LPH21_15595 [Shewanella sp.]|nr:hypothetical protein [Shewanella sp.]MCF1431404.1 hypothetical protein [Shewanella sp.]MCF1458912.1 hypothetical protein [Shewanella sp.]